MYKGFYDLLILYNLMDMRNFFVVLACMTSILLIVACAKSPVDKAMEKIDKSIEKVEKNKDKMTKKDFEALDKEMEEPLKVLNDALENDEVGALDKLKIVGKVTKWAAVLVSAGFKVVGDELGKELKESGVTGEDVKKALEGVETTTGDDVKKVLEEVKSTGDEVKKTLEELQSASDEEK